MSIVRVALLVVLAVFSSLTTLVIAEHGYLGFYRWALLNSATTLLFLDLLISLTLITVWMSADAHERRISPLPYIAITLAIGAAGPLLYLIRRSGARAPGGSSRQWRKRLTASAVVGAIFAVGLAAAGAVYQNRESAFDRGRYGVPGRLVDIGGYRLHLHCQGTGSPTVVIDVGAGNWSIFWSGIQRQLAGSTRVCTYDRAGLGWSDRSPLPRTSDRMAEELHRLLQNGSVTPPYVLVGHSLGSYTTRVFADRYPDEVVGVALVEAAHERQFERLPRQVRKFRDAQVARLREVAWLARLGVLRMRQRTLPVPSLGPELQGALRAALLRPATYDTLADEAGSADVSALQVVRAASLGDRPLAIVTAGNSFETFRSPPNDIPIVQANRIWLSLQADLRRLSTNSRQWVSPAATHNIQLDDPEVVSNAIGTVISAVRSPASKMALHPEMGFNRTMLPWVRAGEPQIGAGTRNFRSSFHVTTSE